ncbi:MAG: hypothetical protein J4F28_07265 [Nitrosopumilaceae archaeon]|nr:hypothetical protein [Nitrosopumilaceae archaeon]
MYACKSCGTTYPGKTALCAREHCTSCGRADLRITRVYEKPDFIVVHACLIMWLLYSCVAAWLEPAYLAVGACVYPFALMILWLERQHTYVCRACGIHVGEPETGAAVKQQDAAQSTVEPRRRRLAWLRRRGGLAFVVSACVVVAFADMLAG